MAITRVGAQAGGVIGDDITSVSRAFPGNVTSGNLIVCGGVATPGDGLDVGDWSKSAGTATVGAFALDASVDGSGATADLTVHVASVLVTGTGSCTITWAGHSETPDSYVLLATSEYASDAGGFDASRLEASSTGGAGSGNASSGNGTSAGAALFYGAVAVGNDSTAITITPDAAFSQIYEGEDGSAHMTGAMADRIVGAGTTDAAEWTLADGAAAWVAALAVYKEVGGGGGEAGQPTGRRFVNSRRGGERFRPTEIGREGTIINRKVA